MIQCPNCEALLEDSRDKRITNLEKENEMLRDILNQIEDFMWIYRHNNYPTKE